MKKVLLTVALILAVLAGVSAQQVVSLYGSPYSLLYVDSSRQEPIKSVFGFGGMVDYRANPLFDNDFFVGANAGVQVYKFTDYADYVTFAGKANAGYTLYVTDDFTVSPSFGVGLDVNRSEESNSVCFAVGPTINLAYNLQGSVDISVVFDGSFSFPKTIDEQFAIYRMNMFVGASYKF